MDGYLFDVRSVNPAYERFLCRAEDRCNGFDRSELWEQFIPYAFGAKVNVYAMMIGPGRRKLGYIEARLINKKAVFVLSPKPHGATHIILGKEDRIAPANELQ